MATWLMVEVMFLCARVCLLMRVTRHGSKEATKEVGVDNAAPLFDGELVDWLADVDAGVVDDDVH